MKRKHFDAKAKHAQDSGDRYRRLSMAYALGTARESSAPIPTYGNAAAQSREERKRAKAARKAAQKARKDRKKQSRRQRGKQAFVNYSQYINSNAWLAFRKTIFTLRGRQCEECRQTEGEMHLHHLTYERLGHEKPKDVKILCRPCHEKLHPHMKERGGEGEE